MLERSSFCRALTVLVLAGCATAPEPAVPPPPAKVEAPRGPTSEQLAAAATEESRALLAQAETDIQRARAKRALWQQAWLDLIAAREAVAAKDNARAATHARRASELARLGLEQLTFPAVR
jgi:photosystem II stability/assembly factor-like uncharacterized protein